MASLSQRPCLSIRIVSIIANKHLISRLFLGIFYESVTRILFYLLDFNYLLSLLLRYPAQANICCPDTLTAPLATYIHPFYCHGPEAPFILKSHGAFGRICFERGQPLTLDK